MTARFTSEGQRRLFSRVTSGLASIGYSEDLLEIDYEYRDYLAPDAPLREIQAACFGRLPVDYETALLGVAASNGESGRTLVNSHRALGSPLILEVGDDKVRVWAVGRDESATREAIPPLSGDEFPNWIKAQADALGPREFLRTKNIRHGESQLFQGSLFAGLIPELEERIAGLLEPRLTAAFQVGISTYRSETGRRPDEATLFKLAFWMLTGKVFFDRQHSKFRSLGNAPTPNDVLERVAEHYNEDVGRLLTETTREAVLDRIWGLMDFRHLSVEVLSQIWSRTLVTDATRERLGIHRTPYSLVRYIVDRMPLEPLPAAGEFVVEPCCGSAVFLVAALNRMRDIIGAGMSALERHKYFRKVLRGFERDQFGKEIAKLCLALSDYPNANHWFIEPTDVLKQSDVFQTTLAAARVVMCNPPYGTFDKKERQSYPEQSMHRALAVLDRVLAFLAPGGSLGFVLPRVFIDSRGYKHARHRIASRFANIELVTLPDKGWEFADQETVLLIATNPRSVNSTSPTQVRHRHVRESGWQEFDWLHQVGTEGRKRVTPVEAKESLAIPELDSLWQSLSPRATIGTQAEVHRGIEWNKDLTDDDGNETGWRDKLVQETRFPGSRRGIPPLPQSLYSKAERTIHSFEPPMALRWLDMSDKHRRGNAHDYQWDRSKVILNAVTRSRGKWRIAAFADSEGLVCYQNLTGVWPHDARNSVLFAAILNGPLANAYATDHEGKRHVTNDTIEAIPLPHIDDKLRRDVESLVATYVQAVSDADEAIMTPNRYGKADEALRRLDARVLRAYQLMPRQERLLLDYFNDDHIHYGRQVPFKFTNYFPENMEMYLTLHEYLSPKRQRSTMGRLLTAPKPPKSVRDALKSAADMHTQ